MSPISHTLFFLICLFGPFLSIVAQVPDKDKTLVIEVKSKTGRVWMDRNLGATQAANSSVHSTSFGHLFQWGRFSDGHQQRSSKTSKKLVATTTSDNSAFILSVKSPNDWLKDQNSNLWQGAKGINNPCPINFRLPTSAEFEEEIATWVSKNAKGAILSPLKLPLTGYRTNGDGQVTDSGFSGDYWTSTVEGKNARGLYFDSETAATDGGGRAVGVAIRCIKN